MDDLVVRHASPFSDYFLSSRPYCCIIRNPAPGPLYPELSRLAYDRHTFLYRHLLMQAILDYLKNTGERLDTEIATATGLSLANVRSGVTELKARGAIMVCRSIRYQEGKEIEGLLCRISGYIPQAAPGRKPKAVAQAKAAAEAIAD